MQISGAIGLGLCLAATQLGNPHFAAQADPAAPTILSGVVLDEDGQPAQGVTVTVSATKQVVSDAQSKRMRKNGQTGRASAARVAENVVSDSVTDDDGQFEVAGDLDVPATRNPDGSVQLEIMTSTPDMVRFYWVNATPPATDDSDWTWSRTSADPTIVDDGTADGPTTAEIAGGPVEDLSLPMGDTESDTTAGSKSSQRPAARTSVTADDWTAPNSEADVDEPASQGETSDVNADQAAEANGTMDDVEAGVADKVRQCATGNGELDWLDGNAALLRWVPIHSDYLRSKFKHSFEWETTHTTTMDIAVDGAGENYSGGLAYSRKNSDGTGFDATKGASQTNVNHLWRMKWVYIQQEQWCYNAGYPYQTGRTRWIADHWHQDVDTPEGKVQRWTCNSNYRSKMAANYWVSRSTSRTWSGWYAISGVKLDAKATFTATDDSEKMIRAKYLLKNENGSGYLCGKGAELNQAPFVEEVDAP
jgi:hypothetical protein